MSTPPAPTNRIAFVHASVVPMDRERVLRDYTVLVENGRIVGLGPDATVKIPKDAVRIDARGRYLMPALCDMHVHLLSEAWKAMLAPDVQPLTKNLPDDQFLFPYVANGVTTVQDMAATKEDLAVRQRIERGEVAGPRLILAPMIDGPKKAWPQPISNWVDSPAEAREAVRRAKADGYDKIKVYSFLSKESYDAIVSTAKELNMDVIGHIPMDLSVEYILDSGQKLIAHSEEVAKHTHGNYDPQRIDYFADLMVKRGVWMSPTLVTTQTILQIFDDPGVLVSRPEAVYFRHPVEAGMWAFCIDRLYTPIPAAARQKLRDDFVKFQRPLTKAFFDKGGKLLAGTDTPWPGLVPGFALHRDLGELVAVGLTPYQALRTSTTAPFEYLGEADKAGTIEIGKQGDLILVDANPIEDIAAASKVSGVLMRGRWISGDEIHRKMQEIATANN